MSIEDLSTDLKEYLLRTVRTFFWSLTSVFFLGVILAWVAFAWMPAAEPIYRWGTAIVIVVQAAVLGVVLGGKRVIATGLTHWIERAELGKSTVRMVFSRMTSAEMKASPEPAIASGEASDGPPGLLERLPLALAETRLKQVAERFMLPTDSRLGQRIGRRTLQKIVAVVFKMSLARFRRDAADGHAINIAKVQKDLEAQIDAVLVQNLRAKTRLLTLAIVAALPLEALLLVWIGRAYLSK